MKKSIIIAVAATMMASIAATNQESTCRAGAVVNQTTSIENNNPIEKAFAKDFKIASATSEINYVAEKYDDAWKAELKNVAALIKKSYKYKEDVKRVDDYIADYNSLAKRAFDLEMLNWSDLSQPTGKRTFGTGGPGAAVMAEAKIYKQATLNLIQHYKAMNPDKVKVYKFIYKGKGAEIERLRNQSSGIINPYHPILFSYGIDKGNFQDTFAIGGWKNGKWYKVEDFKLPQDAVNKIKNFKVDLVKGSENYKFYSQSKQLAVSTGSKPEFWVSPASGDKCLMVNVGSIKDKKIKADYIFGINGNWNPLPKKSKWLNKNTYSVDLNNDDKNEIISVSETLNKKNSKQKDVKCYVESKGKKFLVEEVLVDGVYVSKFNVFTLDLNGDGRQEIITIQSGHNVNVAIGQFIDGKVKNVLDFYQGD